MRSSQLHDGKLTFTADQTKTKRPRTVPLPTDLYHDLKASAGRTWLWESYSQDAKVHRPGRRLKDEFSPKTFYWAITDVFRDFNREYHEQKVKPHDLRKRAITLTTLVTQSVDATAHAIGIDPQTARRYYTDATKAFDGEELMRKMADVLRPKTPQPPT